MGWPVSPRDLSLPLLDWGYKHLFSCGCWGSHSDPHTHTGRTLPTTHHFSSRSCHFGGTLFACRGVNSFKVCDPRGFNTLTNVCNYHHLPIIEYFITSKPNLTHCHRQDDSVPQFLLHVYSEPSMSDHYLATWIQTVPDDMCYHGNSYMNFHSHRIQESRTSRWVKHESSCVFLP